MAIRRNYYMINYIYVVGQPIKYFKLFINISPTITKIISIFKIIKIEIKYLLL